MSGFVDQEDDDQDEEVGQRVPEETGGPMDDPQLEVTPPEPASSPSLPLNMRAPDELPAATLYTSTDIGYLKAELERWEKIARELEQQQQVIEDKIKKLKKSNRR